MVLKWVGGRVRFPSYSCHTHDFIHISFTEYQTQYLRAQYLRCTSSNGKGVVDAIDCVPGREVWERSAILGGHSRISLDVELFKLWFVYTSDFKFLTFGSIRSFDLSSCRERPLRGCTCMLSLSKWCACSLEGRIACQ